MSGPVSGQGGEARVDSRSAGCQATGRPGGRARERLVDGGIALAIRLAEWTGPEIMLRLGALLGQLWFSFGLPRTRRVRDQLARAFPDESSAARRRVAREVFVHLGRSLAEGLLLCGRHRKTLVERVEIDGEEHLAAARRAAAGRGVLIVGGHLGNWELGAAKMASLGLPVAGIYRPLRSPALDRAARRMRLGGGDGELPAFEAIAMGPRAGVRFVQQLRAGHDAMILLDQHARSDEGRVVEFFGRPARTRHAPLKLADRAQVPVLCASIRRLPDARHHRIEFQPALQLEAGASDDEGVLRRNLQRVTAEIERQIRANPGQWIWTHRRWRESAGGGPKVD